MAEEADRLLVLFAPGLWPFRSQLDGVVWELTQGMAAALSEVEGLVAYATPRVLVAGEPAVQLMRALPPDELVRDECRLLGASWAVTGRVLEDARGLEVWLNLLDGASGALLWTLRQTPSRERLVWQLTGAAHRLVMQLGLEVSEGLEARLVAPTTSFGALVSWVRAKGARARWSGERELGFDIVRDAARAAALDHGFGEAIELLEEVGDALLAALDDPLDIQRLRESVVGDVSFEPARRLRQAAHERLLALAKRSWQT
jgi:TolB-like protein